jgi:hypothetical protein
VFLILFLVADIYLIVFAVEDLNKPRDVVGSNRTPWLFVIIFLSPIGSIVYLVWIRQQ